MTEGNGARPAAGRGRRGVLRGVLRHERRMVVGGAVLLSTWQAGEALVPVVVGQVIDRAVRTGSTSSLLWGIAALALVFLFLSWSFRLASRMLTRAMERTAHRLRLDVVRRALHPGGGADADHGTGHVLSLTTSDTTTVATSAEAFAEVCAGTTALVVAVVLLLRISVPLGLVVVVGTPLLLLALSLAARPLERRTTTMYGQWANASGVATDMATGVRVLKGLGAEDAASARYRSASQNSRRATTDAAWAYGAHAGATEALTGAFLAIVAGVGGNLALQGEVSIGDLVAAVGLAAFLVGPLRILGGGITQFAQVRAARERLEALVGTPPAVATTSTMPLVTRGGEVRFDDVCSGSLRSLSFVVGRGQSVGIVADVHDAREIVELLRRDRDPEQGAILVDGHSMAALALDDVRREVLVVDHDAALFEGSVLANIDVVAADDDTRRRAVLASATDELLTVLADDEATDVGHRGASLSGGQRQRVALARALAADATVLVLHDPTTAIDAATESRVGAGIAAMRAGRTTLLITTSPALLATTDSVVFIRDGGVVDEGRHADLSADRADYRDLVLR